MTRVVFQGLIRTSSSVSLAERWIEERLLETLFAEACAFHASGFASLRPCSNLRRWSTTAQQLKMQRAEDVKVMCRGTARAARALARSILFSAATMQRSQPARHQEASLAAAVEQLPAAHELETWGCRRGARAEVHADEPFRATKRNRSTLLRSAKRLRA